MNIAIFGYGVMGKQLIDEIENSEHNFVGVIEKHHLNLIDHNNKIFSNLSEIDKKIDVIIDFSHVSNLDEILTFAMPHKIPVLIATTGFNENDQQKIQQASKNIPILLASNTSYGVNVLLETLKKIVPMLADYDIEIIEKHHNQKIDAPSGTAKTILNTINSSLNNPKNPIHGRNGMQKRQINEIGVHAVRGGSIIGDHSIIFAGNDEVIELKHQAVSKNLFAKGAIKSAQILVQKSAGLYNMQDILN